MACAEPVREAYQLAIQRKMFMWTASERFCGDDVAQAYLKHDINSLSNALLLQHDEHKRFGEFSIGFEAVSFIPTISSTPQMLI